MGNPVNYVDPTGQYSIGDFFDDAGDALAGVGHLVVAAGSAGLGYLGTASCPVTIGLGCLAGVVAYGTALVEFNNAVDSFQEIGK